MTANGPAHLLVDADRRAAKIVLNTPAVDIRVVQPIEALLSSAAGVEELEIDLTGVSFADSAVVRLALKAREYVEPLGGRVVIKAPAEVRRLFELTDTAKLFALVTPT